MDYNAGAPYTPYAPLPSVMESSTSLAENARREAELERLREVVKVLNVAWRSARDSNQLARSVSLDRVLDLLEDDYDKSVRAYRAWSLQQAASTVQNGEKPAVQADDKKAVDLLNPASPIVPRIVLHRVTTTVVVEDVTFEVPKLGSLSPAMSAASSASRETIANKRLSRLSLVGASRTGKKGVARALAGLRRFLLCCHA